jgi:hypothetical protein
MAMTNAASARAAAQGAAEYISKPVDFDFLKQQLPTD